VLLLHIKRFKYSGSSREKLTNNVSFPVKVHSCCLLTFTSSSLVYAGMHHTKQQSNKALAHACV